MEMLQFNFFLAVIIVLFFYMILATFNFIKSLNSSFNTAELDIILNVTFHSRPTVH